MANAILLDFLPQNEQKINCNTGLQRSSCNTEEEQNPKVSTELQPRISGLMLELIELLLEEALFLLSITAAMTGFSSIFSLKLMDVFISAFLLHSWTHALNHSLTNN